MVSISPQDAEALARNVYILRITVGKEQQSNYASPPLIPHCHLPILAVATLTCLVYDYILTFNDEKRYVWPSHWSIIKVAFFLNRYMSIVAVVGVLYVLLLVEPSRYLGACKPLFVAFGSLNAAEYCIAEFILYMRAYAVWGCGRRVLVILVIVYVAVTGTGAYFAGPFLQSATVINYRLFSAGCILQLQGSINKPPLILLIFSEIFALSALMVKSSQMPRKSMIMKTLFADGILYFLTILSVSVANLVVLTVTPPDICNLLLITQSALHSICCNRLLFHIRDASSSLVLSPSTCSRPESLLDAHLGNSYELSSPGLGITFARSQASSSGY
ncbi:hypothetical protein M0805_004432 [Coniferiporia weirii]|nr:hypothetical protein M0805_004432 [Coniferiporia weirii]